MKNTIRSLLAATALAVGLAPVANAQVMLTGGDTTFYINFFAQGSTYQPGPPLVKTQATGAQDADGIVGGLLEDTWGIFEVSTILQASGIKYSETPAASRLVGIFYGGVDTVIGPVEPVIGNSNFTQTIISQGLKFDLYYLTAANSFFGSSSSIADNNIVKHNGYGAYQGISDSGTKVLTASVNSNGVQSDIVYNSNFSVFSSTAGAKLNVNFVDPTFFSPPFGSQLSQLNFTLTGFQSTGQIPNPDFLIGGSGPVESSTAVPEPSTYALMGVVGLMGIIAVRRYGSKKLTS